MRTSFRDLRAGETVLWLIRSSPSGLFHEYGREISPPPGARGEGSFTGASKPVPIQRKSVFWTVSENTAIFCPRDERARRLGNQPPANRGCSKRKPKRVSQEIMKGVFAKALGKPSYQSQPGHCHQSATNTAQKLNRMFLNPIQWAEQRSCFD